MSNDTENTVSKVFSIGTLLQDENAYYEIPSDLGEYLAQENICRIHVSELDPEVNFGLVDEKKLFIKITKTSNNETKMGIFCAFGPDEFKSFKEYYDYSSRSRTSQPDPSWQYVRPTVKRVTTQLIKELEGYDFLTYITTYRGAILLKKQQYTLVNTKLSKDGRSLTIVTKEFGTLVTNTWERGGIQGILDFFKMITGNSKAFQKAEEQIKKSVELDIAYIWITPSRSSTEISIYDSKGTRKVTEGYMQYHGINFFSELNNKYLGSNNFCTLLRSDGSIISFDILKAFNSNSIQVTNGNYSIVTKNFRIEIPDASVLRDKYIELSEDKDSAYAELLKLEVLS